MNLKPGTLIEVYYPNSDRVLPAWKLKGYQDLRLGERNAILLTRGDVGMFLQYDDEHRAIILLGETRINVNPAYIRAAKQK